MTTGSSPHPPVRGRSAVFVVNHPILLHLFSGDAPPFRVPPSHFPTALSVRAPCVSYRSPFAGAAPPVSYPSKRQTREARILLCPLLSSTTPSLFIQDTNAGISTLRSPHPSLSIHPRSVHRQPSWTFARKPKGLPRPSVQHTPRFGLQSLPWRWC